jgi:hypothetical protein
VVLQPISSNLVPSSKEPDAVAHVHARYQPFFAPGTGERLTMTENMDTNSRRWQFILVPPFCANFEPQFLVSAVHDGVTTYLLTI